MSKTLHARTLDITLYFGAQLGREPCRSAPLAVGHRFTGPPGMSPYTDLSGNNEYTCTQTRTKQIVTVSTATERTHTHTHTHTDCNQLRAAREDVRNRYRIGRE